MTLHAAALDSSPRLRRVYDLLSSGTEYSTLQIIQYAQVCAVNSIVSELRANGVAVRCRRRTVNGRGRWFYSLDPDAPAGGLIEAQAKPLSPGDAADAPPAGAANPEDGHE